MEDRTHIEPIPFVSPTGQVYVPVFRRRIILIEHYIDESLSRYFRVEGHFVALEPFGGLCHRLRPVDDEPRRIGIEPGFKEWKILTSATKLSSLGRMQLRKARG